MKWPGSRSLTWFDERNREENVQSEFMPRLGVGWFNFCLLQVIAISI